VVGRHTNDRQPWSEANCALVTAAEKILAVRLKLLHTVKSMCVYNDILLTNEFHCGTTLCKFFKF
jgi:hypothetical protein